MIDSMVVDTFEKQVAAYAGSKYGIAVSSQTNAVFLCLEYLKKINKIQEGDVINIPCRTYMSIPMSIINAGLKINFMDVRWSGAYRLHPTNIWDSAVRFTRDMYIADTLYCVSFQYRKLLPIGRGGMVLTNSKKAYDILKKLCFNGRTNGLNVDNDPQIIKGWNMYMTPEQAARGLTFMMDVSEHNEDYASDVDYPDLTKHEVFK